MLNILWGGFHCYNEEKTNVCVWICNKKLLLNEQKLVNVKDWKTGYWIEYVDMWEKLRKKLIN